MPRVLVVDDDPTVRSLLCVALANEGHTVTEAADGATALACVHGGLEVDLVLLDVELGDVSGLDVLPGLRRDRDVPVIVVSGRHDEVDRIVGLRLGADDYVVKPFSVPELMARVTAVLRRRDGGAGSRKAVLRFDPLVIDADQCVVTLDGQPVPTTHLEFKLLLHLAGSPMKVFSRDDLIRDIWRSSPGWQSLNTVTEHVRRLRRKLGPEGDPGWIETVRGTGYRFNPAGERAGVGWPQSG